MTGPDSNRSVRTVGVVALVGAVLAVGFALLRPPTGSTLVYLFYVGPLRAVSTPLFVVVVTAWIGVGAATAYLTGGYVPAMASVAVPMFAAIAEYFVRTNACCSGASMTVTATNVGLAAVAAGAYALVLGSAGYAVGVGARSVQLSGDPERG